MDILGSPVMRWLSTITSRPKRGFLDGDPCPRATLVVSKHARIQEEAQSRNLRQVLIGRRISFSFDFFDNNPVCRGGGAAAGFEHARGTKWNSIACGCSSHQRVRFLLTRVPENPADSTEKRVLDAAGRIAVGWNC